MKKSRIMQRLLNLRMQSIYSYFLKVSMIITVVVSIMFLFVGCDPGTRLTVENRFTYDLTIIHQAEYNNGAKSMVSVVGTAPAGKTTKLKGVFMLSSDVIGDRIVLRGKDSSGLVVWEKTWEFKEFLKLKDEDWKIVVEPDETLSPNP